MADLNIPNLNKRSDKYLFKKKLTLSRKSRRKLLSESFLMLFFSFLIISLNYFVPNKNLLFRNFFTTLQNFLNLIIQIFPYLYKLGLVIFIVISLIFALILLSGSLYRIIRVLRRKTRNINYK